MCSQKQQQFPDQHHIEKIRQRLWCGREFGQAAVMIGAGFSCNADPISFMSPKFPLWWDLMEKMRSHLSHLPKGVLEDLDALQLASEYEKVFGRQQLEQFLIDSIPDKQYNPGKLHKLLLSLPWSDVFTTNYDTLLERTFIPDRKYDTIYNPSDIPGRMKPRIVKLHGSFESYRPFIFTQQDYREYPRKFAPFVNLVQQSIMENAFCLIGFSGEDPNFLNWIEWVRNNLNEYSPPIYLCGLLNLSDYQKGILKSRKVTTIDLSPWFPKSKWHDSSVRHSRALEWFLLNLMYGKSPDLINWLSQENDNTDIKKKWNLSEGLPEIPTSLESLSSPSYFSIRDIEAEKNYKLLNKKSVHKLSNEGLKYFLDKWEKNREDSEKYKGWIILPKKYRDRLWRYTKEWIQLIFNSLHELTSPNDLFLLYELNWRLEKTLTPLVFDNWIEIITSVVNKFNPYPKLIKLGENPTNQKKEKDTKKDDIITPDKKEYQGEEWSWEKITKAWVGLVFALLRSARDSYRKDSFILWKNILKNIVSQNPQWQSRWFYEQCLFHLSRLENDVVVNIVEEWELTSIPDFWQIRKASILAQFGEIKEANRITKRILIKIRSSIQVYETDYYLLSQEGWTMLLDKEVQSQIQWDKGRINDAFETIKGNRDRWRQLDKYYCNPNTEIETLEQILDRPSPQLQPSKEEKKGFLPSTKSITFRYGKNDLLNLLSDIRPAFESLRIFEEGGIPLSLNNIKYQTKQINNAAKWSIPFFPTWSFLTLIQVSQTKSVKEWLSFIDIALLAQEEIDGIYEILYNFFSKVVEQLSNLRRNAIYSNEYLDSKLPVFTEVLSYLCVRLTDEQLEQVFDLAIGMYNIEAFRQSYSVHNLLCKLFEKLFYVLPQSEIIKKLNILLSLPIVEEAGFVALNSDNFKEPFYYIPWFGDFKVDENFDRTQWSDSIAKLINIVQNDTSEARKRAIFRLGKLSRIGGLTSEQENLFAQALYSQQEDNIPRNIDVYSSISILLFLPQDTPEKAKNIIYQYIIDNLQNIHQLNFSSSSNIDKFNQYLKDVNFATCPLDKKTKDYDKYINFSSENVEYFLTEINKLWQNNKAILMNIDSKKTSLCGSDLLEIIDEINNCLSTVILPMLKDSQENIKQLAKELISDLENKKLLILSTLPMMLFIDESADVNEISRKLIFGLSSLNQREINSATMGIKNWLICSQQGQIPPPPPNLLNELISKVIYYRQPRFNFAVYILGDLISMFPDILNQEQIESLLVGLEYLLEETKLPDNWLNWKIFNNDVNTLIDIHERPEYMQSCTYLAYHFYQFYEKKKQSIPEILIKWQETSLQSVFPKVRGIWQK